MAKEKPILVKVDERRWDRMKARAQTLGLTTSQAADAAFAVWLGETLPADVQAASAEAAKRLTDFVTVTAVSNYVQSTSGSSTAGDSSGHFTSGAVLQQRHTTSRRKK